MSRRSEPWNDIETLLDAVRVEEEAMLAVLEALGELDDPRRTSSYGTSSPWRNSRWTCAHGATS